MTEEEKSEAITKLMNRLEMVRRRPGMYMGSATPNAVLAFTSALDIAYETVGIKSDRNLFEPVTLERGWKFNSLSPMAEMQEKGFTDEQIADEMLLIEIEVWKRTYNLK